MAYCADLQQAISLLESDNLTCVLCKGEDVFKSSERGIKPLLIWLDDRISKSGFCAADKVVGKAAAFLYVLLGIKELYASVISTAAMDVLAEFDINVHFATKTDYIINRAGSGRCPMESAVLDINDPDTALMALREKLQQIKSGGNI